MSNPLKTAAEVRAELRQAGLSLAEWARTHKVSYSLSYELLRGRIKGHHGQAHDIAVLMGMKHGQVRRKARNRSSSKAAA
jgi:gp16 family phage-associated protein